ncbi:MAG: TetR/AcrR family transcriptional regulator [Syntrophales bacterium]|nr:TetR/AcrR family transcriptional regulator [Syntrophales bacterium]
MAQKRISTAIRKKQIIDAARKLIVQKGSEHLTIRTIAREVNLSEAAIYRHFKNKREILSFLMSHIMTSMLDEIDRTAANGSPSLETVQAILKNHLSKIEQSRGMSFQIIAEVISFGDGKLNRQVYESINIYIEKLKDLISAGVKGGFIREDIDLDACAMLLFGMIQGMVNIWALGHYSFDLTDKFESLWNVFQEAICKRAGTTSHHAGGASRQGA